MASKSEMTDDDVQPQNGCTQLNRFLYPALRRLVAAAILRRYCSPY
jgi:hypothetical protein